MSCLLKLQKPALLHDVSASRRVVGQSVSAAAVKQVRMLIQRSHSNILLTGLLSNHEYFTDDTGCVCVCACVCGGGGSCVEHT